MSFSKISYLLLVVVVLSSLSLCIHIRRVRLNNAIANRLGLQSLVQRRPHPHPRDREPHPMALELDNWKKHRVDHSEEFTNLELKSCFVQMDDEDDSQRATVHHDTSSLYAKVEGRDEHGSEHEDSASRPSTTSGSETTVTAVHVRHDGRETA
ncbi:hypothetical protein Gpo141_00012406 [Globisporangium polare]